MLKRVVKQEIKNLPFVPKNILVAVSGGSDSFALLDIVLKLKLNPICLHVNHNLRKESDEEEKIVKQFCEKNAIPFISTKWYKPAKTNIEAQAREFRYLYFEKIMANYEDPIILFAHHENDQIETIIQKIIEGNFSGQVMIPKFREFANGYLLRPLLGISKKEIQEYADDNHLPYVIDNSNFDLKFKRNKIRHKIIPYLIKDNPRFSQSLIERTKINNSDAMITLKFGEQLEKTCRIKENEYRLDLLADDLEKYAFARFLVKELTEKYKVSINVRKWKQINKLIADNNGTKELSINKDLILRREYKYLSLNYRQIVEKVRKDVYTLCVSDKIKLSDREWLSFDDKPNFDLTNMQTLVWKVPYNKIIVRGLLPGDKMKIAETKHKKISRILIDAKIPRSVRSKLHVVLNDEEEIIGILPLRKAYLSKFKKTAKMYYITYYYEKG